MNDSTRILPFKEERIFRPQSARIIGSMLSESDIHRVTGFLYVVSRREDITLILGEKVFDEASESSRDVDIVIATAGHYGLAGVEVKDEGRALHVGIVEGICQKFKDMPAITNTAIVSASGYTAPSLKKAAAHGLQCLTIVRGKLPSFPTIDLSGVSNIPVSYLDWLDGPQLTFNPSQQLSSAQEAELRDSTPVVGQEGYPAPGVKTCRELVDRVMAIATDEWKGPEYREGPIPFTLEVEIADQPVIALQSGSVIVRDARITGTVEWVRSVLPISSTCYLANEHGEPVAGTILVEIRSGLAGLAVGSSSQELRLFHIPNSLRKTRPIRELIFPKN